MSGQSTAAKLAAARRRIAELEAALAEATQRIADLEATYRTLHEMYRAQKPDAPKRDPASTTHASLTIRSAPGQATAFGFGLPGAYAGDASVDEGYRDEKWRDAQT